MNSSLRFHHLRDPHDPVLREIEGIYLDSFGPATRKPVEWIPSVTEKPYYRITAATLADKTVGFAISFLPDEEPMAFLEYLAIHPAYRAARIGSTIMDWLITEFADRNIIAEVETDRFASLENKQLIAFYRRLGFQRVSGLEYLLPLGTTPPPMDLLVHLRMALLPLPTLQQWIKIIYKNVYGQRTDDPRIVRMLSTLGNPLGLE